MWLKFFWTVASATYDIDGINKILLSPLLPMKDSFMQNAMYLGPPTE